MGIWKEQSSGNGGSTVVSPVPPPLEREVIAAASAAPDVSRRVVERESPESVIAAELAIEGKIEGSGNVRLMGKFKGDVHVAGNLTIEQGAKLSGSVRAGKVIIGGELEGNIEAASSVELLKTGVLNGDLKAGTLTVAAGSRMRGTADFGGDQEERREIRMKVESRSAS